MTGNSHLYNLERFVEAQDAIYARVLSELKSGKKLTHWMWFVFPQAEGLGLSPAARKYAIKSRGEALEYLAHPVLGRRLLECAGILLEVEGLSADEMFGFPDNMKLLSSMTLFAEFAEDPSVFLDVIKKYYSGAPDGKTISITGGWRD